MAISIITKKGKLEIKIKSDNLKEWESWYIYVMNKTKKDLIKRRFLKWKADYLR